MYVKIIVTFFSPSWPPLAGPVDPRVENPVKNTIDWCMVIASLIYHWSFLLVCIYDIDGSSWGMILSITYMTL